MIDREHDLPISRQAKVLNISQGSAYYRPRPVSTELHLERPFAGARMLRDFLSREGVAGMRIASLGLLPKMISLPHRFL